jgi:hypothetical protein
MADREMETIETLYYIQDMQLASFTCRGFEQRSFHLVRASKQLNCHRTNPTSFSTDRVSN